MDIGEHVPPLAFQATQGLQGKLSDFQGQWLVLYFYPKDATPGCTLEGQAFRDQVNKFAAINTIILGVSRDNLASHERFKAKQNFPFELISDIDETLCQAFQVIKMKSMYGKQVRGIERCTFLIDPQGIVRHVWRGVKVKDHVEQVLNILQALQRG